MICPTCKGGRTLLKKVRGKGCYEVVLDVCDQCNGTGEIKATNFQRITASPEKLAEFIADDRMHCHFATCDVSCNGCTKQGVLEWLNEESKE